MDISAWTEDEMRQWSEQEWSAGVRDIQTYREAKVIKPGLFNRGKWRAAAQNLTRLTLVTRILAGVCGRHSTRRS